MAGPHPASPQYYLRLVQAHLPSLHIHSARPISVGWCCFVLDVNDSVILRFPRTAHDARRVDREARLLPELERRIGVAVPSYEQVIRDPRGRILFVAYPKLKGRRLPTRMLRGARARLWASDILDVLRALERFPRDLGRRLGIDWSERTDRRGRWKVLHPWVRHRIHPLLSAETRKRDAEYWESYLREERSLDLPPSLNHGDFGPEHILVNDRGIAGILDWESACYEDPIAILSGLPSADGFASRIIRNHVGEDLEAVGRRLAFHRHASPAYSVVYGLDTRDPKLVRNAIKRYVRTLPAK